MKMMRLAEMNKYMANRDCMGKNTSTPFEKTDLHNPSALEKIGHELKINPPKVLAKTRKKFGKKRAEKQRKAILLSKARKSGVNIPKK